MQRLSFLELLSEVFDEEKKERQGHNKDYEYRHNPSSASFKCADGKVVGSCLRQLYYKATKVAESNPSDFTSKLQMGFGDAIHSFLLGKLSKSKKIQLTSEASGKCHVDPLQREVSYRLDGLVGYDGSLGCLEIKSKQSYAVQRMMKEGGVSADTLCQVISYHGTNPLLSWTHLVSIGRDNALRVEQRIEKRGEGFVCIPILPTGKEASVPELCFGGIVARWKELEDYVAWQKPPRRDYKAVLKDDGSVTDKRTKKGVDYKSDWRCLYCNYKDCCWTQPDAKQEAVQIPC